MCVFIAVEWDGSGMRMHTRAVRVQTFRRHEHVGVGWFGLAFFGWRCGAVLERRKEVVFFLWSDRTQAQSNLTMKYTASSLGGGGREVERTKYYM